MADLLPVAFHGDTLYLVEHNGEPFAPAKPICEAIGLASREGAPQRAPALPSRPRSATPVKLCSFEVQVSRIEAARPQLEAASGLLCGIEFARDQQTRLDLLVAAHTQCQAASLFIANHYEEVRGHA